MIIPPSDQKHPDLHSQNNIRTLEHSIQYICSDNRITIQHKLKETLSSLLPAMILKLQCGLQKQKKIKMCCIRQVLTSIIIFSKSPITWQAHLKTQRSFSKLLHPREVQIEIGMEILASPFLSYLPFIHVLQPHYHKIAFYLQMRSFYSFYRYPLVDFPFVFLSHRRAYLPF